PAHGAPARVEPADERADADRPGPAAARGRAGRAGRRWFARTLISSPLMHALYLVVPVLGILAIAYRYYSAFIATRIWMLDDARTTPAHTNYDGANYYPTSRWVLFGHHFAAIAGAGPLVGPMLAAQFGYAPGLIWLVAGVCLAGAVHDFVILWASVRRKACSLADMARSEISPVAGVTAAVA